jgi:hypothetical protein
MAMWRPGAYSGRLLIWRAQPAQAEATAIPRGEAVPGSSMAGFLREEVAAARPPGRLTCLIPQAETDVPPGGVPR